MAEHMCLRFLDYYYRKRTLQTWASEFKQLLATILVVHCMFDTSPSRPLCKFHLCEHIVENQLI